MTGVEVHVAREGSAVELAIEGEIDLTNWESVGERLNAEITNQTTEVRVDLSGVTYLDSSGLRLLFKLADRLSLLQVGLTLAVPDAAVNRRVIQLSGLDQVVPVRPPTT
jgi:anti-anti-sigma factor